MEKITKFLKTILARKAVKILIYRLVSGGLTAIAIWITDDMKWLFAEPFVNAILGEIRDWFEKWLAVRKAAQE